MRRRVIQLTPYYPPHLGGVERVAEALARGLAPSHDVEVWTTDRGAVRVPAAPLDTFPVRRMRAVEIAHTPIPFALMNRLLQLRSDSVVHVHVAQAFWPELVALAAAVRGFRFVAHFHLDVDPSGAAGFLLPFYKRHLLVRALRRADAVIALTPGQADMLVERYSVLPERVFVIANGVDEAFLRLRSPRGERQGALRVLFVGRLDVQKNVPRLLGALARVAAPVEAVIVGDGQQRELCEAIRDRLDLGNVRLVGAQHGEDLVDWYKWADVFVLSSDREGMPLALLEAIAAGLPVVATDVSDLPDQVGDAGLVVRPDEAELAVAITRLALDRHLLETLRERSRVRGESLGWSSSVASVASVYESLPS